MRKIVIILACMLVCLSIFSGCTDDKDNSSSGTDIDNSVEIESRKQRFENPCFLDCNVIAMSI